MYSEEFIERFWKKVDKKPDGCWLWTGNKQHQGYGRTRIDNNPNGAKRLVHRISLELHLGRPIADDMMVAHAPVVCHNRLCVNPAHLREATAFENAFDRELDETVARGEKGGKTKLTEGQVIAIKADARVQRIIAKQYNVSQSTISLIKQNKNWKYIH
jgi:hypothetical protein